MDSLGTTESIVCVKKNAIINQKMIEMNITCSIYPFNNLYAYLTFLLSSGSILKWFRDNLMETKKPNLYSCFDKIVEKKYKNLSRLFLLPHFAGSGTPYLDFNSRGIIAGFTLDTDKYQIYKAILEGTCMESRLNIELMENVAFV